MQLEYPQSLAVYDTYADAQRAVDYLADQEFPVENCLIVGTDLKQLERITGRLTWSKVALGGAASGVWLGLFVGLVLSLFSTDGSSLGVILATALFGERSLCDRLRQPVVDLDLARAEDPTALVEACDEHLKITTL